MTKDDVRHWISRLFNVKLTGNVDEDLYFLNTNNRIMCESLLNVLDGFDDERVKPVYKEELSDAYTMVGFFTMMIKENQPILLDLYVELIEALFQIGKGVGKLPMNMDKWTMQISHFDQRQLFYMLIGKKFKGTHPIIRMFMSGVFNRTYSKHTELFRNAKLNYTKGYEGQFEMFNVHTLIQILFGRLEMKQEDFNFLLTQIALSQYVFKLQDGFKRTEIRRDVSQGLIAGSTDVDIPDKAVLPILRDFVQTGRYLYKDHLISLLIIITKSFEIKINVLDRDADTFPTRCHYLFISRDDLTKDQKRSNIKYVEERLQDGKG